MVRYEIVEKKRAKTSPTLKVSVSEDAIHGEVDIHIGVQLALTLNNRGTVRLWPLGPIEGLEFEEIGSHSYLRVERETDG